MLCNGHIFPQVCSVELMQREFPGRKVEEYRRMLGSFGVTGDLALQQVRPFLVGRCISMSIFFSDIQLVRRAEISRRVRDPVCSQP